MAQPSVLIVDDHLVVRQGLRQIVAEEFPHAEFGEAGTADDALAWLSKRRWDLAVVDVGLPGKDGFQFLEDVRRRGYELKILIVSVHSEYQFAARALHLGALGYVSKDAPRAELIKALKTVLSGETYVGKSLTNKPGPKPPRIPSSGHEILSAREYRVMLALAAGKRVKEIAVDLNVSVKTISTYRRRVLDKMHLSSTADLVRYVIHHNLS